MTALSAREIRVIAPDNKNKYAKKINSLAKFAFFLIRCWEHAPYIIFFVNSDLRGKKLLLLQQFAFWRKKWGGNSVMLFKLRPDHNEFASIAFKEM